MNEDKKYPKVSVSAFIFNSNNELLMVKSKKWQNKYTTVGGKIEVGEKIEDTINREVFEETTLKINNLVHFNVIDGIGLGDKYKDEDDHFVFINYLAKTNDKEIKLNEELSGYKWLKLDEWLKMSKKEFAPYIYQNLEKLKDSENKKLIGK